MVGEYGNLASKSLEILPNFAYECWNLRILEINLKKVLSPGSSEDRATSEKQLEYSKIMPNLPKFYFLKPIKNGSLGFKGKRLIWQHKCLGFKELVVKAMASRAGIEPATNCLEA